MLTTPAFERVDRALQASFWLLLLSTALTLAAFIFVFMNRETLAGPELAKVEDQALVRTAAVVASFVYLALAGALCFWNALIRYRWLQRDRRALTHIVVFAILLLVLGLWNFVGSVGDLASPISSGPVTLTLRAFQVVNLLFAIVQTALGIYLMTARRQAAVRDVFPPAFPA